MIYTNQMSNRVKIITYMEVLIMPIVALFLIISVIYSANAMKRFDEYMGIENGSIGVSEVAVLGLVIGLFIYGLLCLPYLIVAIRNFKNKKSNNNILIIVFSVVYAILLLINLIMSFSDSWFNIVSIIYLMVLIILIVQEMQEAKTKTIHVNQMPKHMSYTPELRYCPNCGAQQTANAKFCQHCGAKQNN